MPTATTFALFSAAALALIVVPGPAVTYVVTQSLDKGRRAGIVSALGVGCGGLFHVTAATAGLSALIASSASAFTVVKLCGSIALQAAILGFVFVLLAVLSDSTYAVVAAALARRIRGSRRAAQVKRWVSGGIFVALGATAAAARRT